MSEYKMAPREPTAGMVNAGSHKLWGLVSIAITADVYVEMWRAMWDVAPSPNKGDPAHMTRAGYAIPTPGTHHTINEGGQDAVPGGMDKPSPVPPSPDATMEDAIAAGDGTLHGAIDYWQARAEAAEKTVERWQEICREDARERDPLLARAEAAERERGDASSPDTLAGELRYLGLFEDGGTGRREAFHDAADMIEALAARAEAAERNLGMEKTRVAMLTKDGAEPCCQDFELCTRRCSPLVHALRARAEAAERTACSAHADFELACTQVDEARAERDALRADVERLRALLRRWLDEYGGSTWGRGGTPCDKQLDDDTAAAIDAARRGE